MKHETKQPLPTEAWLPYAELRRAAVERYHQRQQREIGACPEPRRGRVASTYFERLQTPGAEAQAWPRQRVARGQWCDQEGEAAWMVAERAQELHPLSPCSLCAAAGLPICEPCQNLSTSSAQRWAEEFVRICTIGKGQE